MYPDQHNYLIHHGIKGQKWGVRRFQNKDGTRTREGIYRRRDNDRILRVERTRASVDSIINSMTLEDRKLLNVEHGYIRRRERGAYVAKRVLITDMAKTPVAFFDLQESRGGVYAVVGTRGGSKYRNKGYATQAAKKGFEWYEKNKERFGYDELRWYAYTKNEKSIGLAKKMGLKPKYYNYYEVTYSDQVRKTPEQMRREAKREDRYAAKVRRRYRRAPEPKEQTQLAVLERLEKI